MGVYVVNRRLVGHPRVGKRDLDCADGAFPRGIRGGYVVGVGSGAVASELRVYLRAASFRMLLRLEDESRRALAHHKAVAISVERPARPFRRIVEMRGKRLHLHEAADGELDYAPFRSAGDHDVSAPCANEVHCIPDGVGRACAGSRNHLARPLRANGNGDVARSLVGDELRNGKRRKPVGPAVEERLVVLARYLDAADSDSEDRSNPRHVGTVLLGIAGVFPSLLRNRHRELREPRHVTGGLFVHKAGVYRIRLEVLYFCRDLARAFRGVKIRDLADARLPGLDRGPRRVLAVAARAQHSDSGYHHPFHVSSAP